jgi:GGDEF domain-containing protein
VALDASLGVAIAVPDISGTDPRRLLHQADMAMYRAKQTGAAVVTIDGQSHPGVPDRPRKRLRERRTPPRQPPPNQS